MPFFQDDSSPKAKPGKTSQEALYLADRHRKYWNRKGITVYGGKKDWAVQFQIMLNKLNYRDLLDVLNWYHTNHPKIVHKVLINGKQFKDNYDLILSFMKGSSAPTIEVSEEARKIAADLKTMYTWAKGSAPQLPEAVQITLDSFTAFRKKLKAYCEANPKQVKVGKAKEKEGYTSQRVKNAPPHVWLAHTLKDVIGSPESLTRAWMKEVGQSVANWPEWSGNLIAMAFNGDLSSKRFNMIGKKIASEFGASAESWEKLLEELS